jgi:two-component system chemotaxis sensor kinase CheA
VSGLDPIETFRQEAQDLLEEIEQGLLDLAHRPGDRDLVDAVFRGLHTLKGSGAMFGFDALAAFTHHCETAFDRVRKGEVAATPEPWSAPSWPPRTTCAPWPRAPRLRRCRRRPAGRPAACRGRRPPAETAAAPRARPEPWRVRFSLPADALVNGARPLPCWTSCATWASAGRGRHRRRARLRRPGPHRMPPGLGRGPWSPEHGRDAIEDVFIFVIDDMTLDIEDLNAAVAEAEAPLTSSRLSSPSPRPRPGRTPPPTEGRKAGGDTVRVPAERLDEMMDRVGELVIAQSRLKQVAASSSDIALRAVAEEIERLAAEMRDTMMVVRMVPIAQLFGRFRRLIHDLARDTGKTDRAVDRGRDHRAGQDGDRAPGRSADPPDPQRRRPRPGNAPSSALPPASPRPAGSCWPPASPGAEVVITITDDGRGVDRARVRAKAEENGLIQPGQVLTDRSCCN